MNIDLTLAENDLQAEARAFCQSILAPLTSAHPSDQSAAPYLALATHGWMSALWPSAQGEALRYRSFVLVIEELARVDLSLAIAVAIHTCLAAMSIVDAGRPEQQARYLPPLAAGQLAAFAVTEPDAGSDPGSLTMLATPTFDGFVLNGRKTWVSNGGLAQTFVLFASTHPPARHRGVTAFIVDRQTPGLRLLGREPTLGLPRLGMYTIALEQCHVAANQVLGEVNHGWPIILRAFDRVRISLAAAALGAAGAALDHGLAYASQREQFGSVIAHKQAIQALLADSALEIEALRALVRRAATQADAGASYNLAASQAKLFGARAANAVCDRMLQLFGGAGFSEHHPLADLYRDVRALRLLGGTDQVQGYVIARALLEPLGVRIQP
jgi:hypothetical protein